MQTSEPSARGGGDTRVERACTDAGRRSRMRRGDAHRREDDARVCLSDLRVWTWVFTAVHESSARVHMGVPPVHESPAPVHESSAHAHEAPAPVHESPAPVHESPAGRFYRRNAMRAGWQPAERPASRRRSITRRTAVAGPGPSPPRWRPTRPRRGAFPRGWPGMSFGA